MNNLDLTTLIKEVVKEALREVLAESGLINHISPKSTPIEKEVKKASTISNSQSVKNMEKAPVEEDYSTLDPSRAEELEAMSFKDVQNIAKELGLKAVGAKKSLIEKILEAEGVSGDKDEETMSNDKEENVDQVDEKDTEPTIYDKVVAELKDSTDKELADILDSVGISPKGKRQALLTKIVQAVEEGKLDWSDDEDTSANKKGENEDENVEAEVITPERASAMEELEDSIREAYKDEEISDKDIADFLNDYYNGDYKGNKKENLENYITIQCALIDDDGEAHEFEDPYLIGEDTYCCGAKLKELENGSMYCEKCGTEFTE